MSFSIGPIGLKSEKDLVDIELGEEKQQTVVEESDDEVAPLSASPALPVTRLRTAKWVDSLPVDGGKSTKPFRKKELYPEVDIIKAVGIVTVVLIHCLPVDFSNKPISAIDDLVARCTRFAVPGFLACSGYLFAASRSASLSWRGVVTRLERLLVPYLIFSACAWFMSEGLGDHESMPNVIWKLLTCSQVGPYYYVFVIMCLVLATPLIARIPLRILPAVTIAAIMLHAISDANVIPKLPIFWQLRTPTRSLGPFFLGWCSFCFREHVLGRLEKHRKPMLASLCFLVVFLVGSMALLPKHGSCTYRIGLSLLETVQTYSTVILLFAWGSAFSEAPALATWLSHASYTIYLSHLFFILPFILRFEHTDGDFDPLRTLAGWSGALCASSVLVLLSRAALGEDMARYLVG